MPPKLILRAGRWRRAPAPTAEALAAVLETTAETVRRVRVREHSLFARLHGSHCVATTRSGTIYLCGSAEAFFDDPELMLHEYYHVIRQWNTGELSVLRYLAESARRGYWRNAFEVAARRFTRERLPALRAMLRVAHAPGPASPSFRSCARPARHERS